MQHNGSSTVETMLCGGSLAAQPTLFTASWCTLHFTKASDDITEAAEQMRQAREHHHKKE